MVRELAARRGEPRGAYALNRAFFETDLREILPAVRVPTLVLYREHTDRPQPERHSSTPRVPGARACASPGRDYFGIFLSPEVVDEIERFVAGEEAPGPSSVLATIMFTDIVGSTERAAELGDRAWRDLLARAPRVVRRELARFRARSATPPATASSPPSKGQRARSARARRSSDRQRGSGSSARIGIHVGECELHEDKVAGLAVNIGARVAAKAGANESASRRRCATSWQGLGIAFDDRGSHELKGIPGAWQLFAVSSGGD